MRRCPLCFRWHENKVHGCPPPEEIAADLLKDDSMLTPEDPPYVKAALESAKAASARLEVEKAAALLKAEGESQEGMINCRTCEHPFQQIFGETQCMFCREGVERKLVRGQR